MYEVTDGKGSHRYGGSKRSTVATGASGDRDIGQNDPLVQAIIRAKQLDPQRETVEGITRRMDERASVIKQPSIEDFNPKAVPMERGFKPQGYQTPHFDPQSTGDKDYV